MRSVRFAVLAAALLFTAAGCSFTVTRYTPGPERPQGLQHVPADARLHMVVTQSAGDTTPGICRLSAPVALPSGDTYATYLQGALREEMARAGIREDATAPAVTVEVQQVDFQSMVSNGYWQIVAKVSNALGVSSVVTTKHPFDASFTWWSACHETASELPPATQQFAGDVFNTPAFQGALRM